MSEKIKGWRVIRIKQDGSCEIVSRMFAAREAAAKYAELANKDKGKDEEYAVETVYL